MTRPTGPFVRTPSAIAAAPMSSHRLRSRGAVSMLSANALLSMACKSAHVASVMKNASGRSGSDDRAIVKYP